MVITHDADDGIIIEACVLFINFWAQLEKNGVETLTTAEVFSVTV